MNKYIKYSALGLIPISLYINFFLFKLTLWSYELKAWIIYSLLYISADIITISLVKQLLIKLYKHKSINKLISFTALAFLLGNLILMFPTFRLKIWYILPLFKSLLIFLFLTFLINKKSPKNKLSLSKKLFTLKKTPTSKEQKKLYIFLVLSILLYFTVSIILYYIIENNYNPLDKSLDYFLKDYNLKVVK